jgi:hypothetical protein
MNIAISMLVPFLFSLSPAAAQDVYELGALPHNGSVSSVAYDINNNGVVVDRTGLPNGFSTFKWTATADMVQLSLPSSWSVGEATGVNESGTIIGLGTGSNGCAGSTDFLHENWRLKNANSLSNNRPSGVSIADVRAINEEGWMVGRHGGPSCNPSTFLPSVLKRTASTGPTLTVTGLFAGGTSTVALSGCTPNAMGWVAYSIHGPGPTNTQWGEVQLSQPIRILPFISLGATGKGSISIPIPPGVSGVSAWIQGFDPERSTFTNALALTIG